jgi:hypothetical protein
VLVDPPSFAISHSRVKVQPDDVIVQVRGQLVPTAEQAVAALANLPLDEWQRLETIRPGAVR